MTDIPPERHPQTLNTHPLKTNKSSLSYLVGHGLKALWFLPKRGCGRSWICSKGYFLHDCALSAKKHRSSITILAQQTSTVLLQHLSSSTPNISRVTSAVFTTTVIQLFEDQYMKRMSVIQLSEMRRVTTCCRRPRIS